MNSKQVWFNHHHSRGVAFLLAVMLLAVTSIPALAWNTPVNPDKLPLHHCVVVFGDQVSYSNGCLDPGRFPRLPEIVMRTPAKAQTNPAVVAKFNPETDGHLMEVMWP